MTADPPRLAVCADPPHEVPLQARAGALAEALSIDKTRLGGPDCDVLLAVTQQRLELRVIRGEADLIGGQPVFADLASIDTTSPAGRKLDMPLLKAVGIKKGKAHRPSVIDATAGLGEDAWLLAAHGCAVCALERHPVVAVLLADAHERARQTHPDTAQRLTTHHANAIDRLANPARRERPAMHNAMPDAIVLDPMFPKGRKAKERKPMRVLRMLAGDDDDAPRLLDTALQTGVHRVCVKRPLKAPVIEHPQRAKPDVVYKGKAVRFDVYLNH